MKKNIILKTVTGVAAAVIVAGTLTIDTVPVSNIWIILAMSAAFGWLGLFLRANMSSFQEY